MSYLITKKEAAEIETALAKTDKPMLNRIRVNIILDNVTRDNKKEKLERIFNILKNT